MNLLTKAIILALPFVLTGCVDGNYGNSAISLQTQQQQNTHDLTSNKEMDISKVSSIKITLPAYNVIYRALDESTADEKPDAKACPAASPGCLRWIADMMANPHVAWPANGEEAYAKNVLTASLYANQLFKQAIDASGSANSEQALYDSVLITLKNAELKKPKITRMFLDFSGKCSVGFIATADDDNYDMCQSSVYSDRLIKRNGLAWLNNDGWIDGRKIILEEIRSSNLEISKLLSYKQGLQDNNSQISQQVIQFNTK
jgi:hypothetical protein